MQKETLFKLWNMQADLNRYIGIDSLNIGKSDNLELKDQWTNDFIDQAHNEASEAKDCFLHKWWSKEVKHDPKRRFDIIDEAKLKVEIIDIIHFVISACQTHYDGDFDLFYEDYVRSIRCYSNVEMKSSKRMIYDRLAYFNTCNSPEVCMCIIDLIVVPMNMKDNEILKIYELKWEANKKRQDNSYSMLKKDEKDNQEIENKIR